MIPVPRPGRTPPPPAAPNDTSLDQARAPIDVGLARRTLSFLFWVGMLPFAFLALCLLIPPDAISPEAGIWASLVTAGVALWVTGLLLRKYQIAFPVRMKTVAVIAVLKLAVGLLYWHTYLYDVETGRPRIDFAMNEIYQERRADVECIFQLIRVFERSGVHYVTPAEAEITINNRPPAHAAAIIVRAFGEQIPAFFSFNALVVTLGAIAVTVTLGAFGLRGRRLDVGAWIVLLWPYGWQVAMPGKDLMLFAFVAICAAILIVGEIVSVTFPWGVLYGFCVLPLFRPVYALVCAVLGTSLLLRRKVPILVKISGLVLVVSLGLGLTLGLSLEANVEQHAQWAPNESRLLAIPVVGRIVFGLATPFPWTQILDGWWKYPMAYLFAQQVFTLAVFWCIIQSVGAKVVRRAPDLGVLLGMGLVIGGLVVPNTQALYVHVGVIAMLPFALAEARRDFRYYLKRSAMTFVAGNALWMLIR